MTISKNTKIITGIGVGLLVLLVVGYINSFVYPFKSAQPNYKDVETVFNKLQIPEDWVEIQSSENRGIAGRACPIESDGCFSKSKTFKLPDSTVDDVSLKKVLNTAGCVSPTLTRTEVQGRKDRVNLECVSGFVKLFISVVDRGTGYEYTVIASSR